MIGVIATFKDNGSWIPEMKGVVTCITAKKGTSFYNAKCDSINDFMKDEQVDPVGFLILTDEDLFYSKRLEAGVMELQTYTEYHDRYIKKLKEDGSPEDVIEETIALLISHEETLMRRVASRVRSCMIRDIEVTNELAIECYNWYESKRV